MESHEVKEGGIYKNTKLLKGCLCVIGKDLEVERDRMQKKRTVDDFGGGRALMVTVGGWGQKLRGVCGTGGREVWVKGLLLELGWEKEVSPVPSGRGQDGRDQVLHAKGLEAVLVPRGLTALLEDRGVTCLSVCLETNTGNPRRSCHTSPPLVPLEATGELVLEHAPTAATD